MPELLRQRQLALGEEEDLTRQAQAVRQFGTGGRIVEQRDRGVGVLLVSAELDEILGLADRVAVLYEGRVVAVLDAADADRERVGLLMAGVKA